MAKKINLIVNTGNEETSKTIEVVIDNGKKGSAERVKAVKGARYQLEDTTAKNVGPEKIRSKRVGKNLHIMLDGSGQADLIIEGYYDEEMVAESNRGLYGRAEDGNLYEYTLGADALFPIGKSDINTISERGRKVLDQLIIDFKKEFGTDGRALLHIVGHADKYGNPASNLALSKDRAESIKTYFAEGGIPRKHMTTDGRGDKEPVITTCGKAPTKENIACNMPNRRVVIEVTLTQPVDETK